jgi:hypothetical protein
MALNLARFSTGAEWNAPRRTLVAGLVLAAAGLGFAWLVDVTMLAIVVVVGWLALRDRGRRHDTAVATHQTHLAPVIPAPPAAASRPPKGPDQ